MRLGDKHPVKYKLWCIIRNVVLELSIRINIMYDKINRIHYAYWTYGETLKELKILKESEDK